MKSAILLLAAAFGAWFGSSLSFAAGAPTFLAAFIGIVWGCGVALCMAAVMINSEDD